jgi:chemotaxis protein methyltransferase CheR
LNDAEYVELLQWALPRLGLRWEGFRNVRRQVCRRIAARIRELGLPDAASYRRRLESDPAEARVLDALCFVTISRFYRDRAVFDALRDTLVPRLAEDAIARGDVRLRAWSAGCASGEEPYTLAMLWHLVLAPRYPALGLEIIATDFDEGVLARAARGCYEASSLRELPTEWARAAFEGGCVRNEIRRYVTFVRADLRAFTPAPPLHLVLCRNSVFTYFDEETQRAFLRRALELLVRGGLVVVGGHEKLPAGVDGLAHPPGAPRSVLSSSSSAA